MRKLRRKAPVALALILASLSSSCGIFSGFLYRTRMIPPRKGKVSAAQQPLKATRDQLTERISKLYDATNSFIATIAMSASLGSVDQGKITELADVRAYILFRKPSDIRIVAKLPVVGTQAFDMVSNASDFRFYYNSKNLFVIGSNSAPATSKSKIENLRPAAFLSSMLIMPPALSVETPVLVNLTDEDNADYILVFVVKLPNGDLHAAREVWFDRFDLSIIRQRTFDADDDIVSDTHYAEWTLYNGVSFPAHIDIQRPKEAYGLVMNVDSMQMNVPLTDDKFLLPQPAGSQLQVIGSPRDAAGRQAPE
jgi:hypothetical protein